MEFQTVFNAHQTGGVWKLSRNITQTSPSWIAIVFSQQVTPKAKTKSSIETQSPDVNRCKSAGGIQACIWRIAVKTDNSEARYCILSWDLGSLVSGNSNVINLHCWLCWSDLDGGMWRAQCCGIRMAGNRKGNFRKWAYRDTSLSIAWIRCHCPSCLQLEIGGKSLRGARLTLVVLLGPSVFVLYCRYCCHYWTIL